MVAHAAIAVRPNRSVAQRNAESAEKSKSTEPAAFSASFAISCAATPAPGAFDQLPPGIMPFIIPFIMSPMLGISNFW